MMVLRVLSAEKSGKQSLDVAGLLKIRGSEIQQRYTELMMLAAGPAAVPLNREAIAAGWQPGQLDGPQQVSPGAAMPDLQVSEGDARDITAFLYTRH